MFRILITLIIFAWVTSAQAGFFDDVLNKAKEVTEETVKKTVETVSGDEEKEPTKVQEPNPSPPESASEVSVKQPASKVNPTEDKQLVKEIQQRLKDLGYKVGVVDGLYGPSTRKAIVSFQQQQGSQATGKPSTQLLSQLQQAEPAKMTDQTLAEGAVAIGAAFSEPSAVHGRWQGALSGSTNHILASAGIEIFLSDTVNVARIGYYARKCLADLTQAGAPGHYRARFLSGRETCGESATIVLEPKGGFKVTWDDAPAAAGKTLKGQIERTYAPQPRNYWSSALDDRKANDVVGFYPGMTYQEAQAHWEAGHKDLKREIRWVRDKGTSAIVIILTPKESAKAGQSQLKEQISLGFESQTPEELPQVKNLDASSNAEDVRRAEARLMYIHRFVVFADRKGPTLDTLRAALSKKYGPPSVDKKTAFRVLQWSYDQNNHRIANATGGICDHWQRYSNRDLAPNYKPAQTARIPYVTVHPDCGLTIKARVKLYDVAVREMDVVAYDQQRLMGDQWYGLENFNAALVAEHRAKAKAMQQQQAPDL